MSASDADSSSIRTVGLAGLGTLGRGIAACFLGYGFKLIVLEPNAAARAKARAYIQEALQELVERAGFPNELPQEWTKRYIEADSPAAFAPCDFVAESIIEDERAKTELFTAIESHVRADVPIATNTSAIPISLLQKGRAHPERFVGMHWLQPAYVTRFLEVIRGEQTNDRTFRLTEALGWRLGKEPALVHKDAPGFVANRLGYALMREAMHLIEEGVADPQTIERCMRHTWGSYLLVAGPLRNMDLWGLPLYAQVMERLFPELSNAQGPPPILRRMIEAGNTGAPAGKGWFEYAPGEAEQWERRIRELQWDMRALAEKYKERKP